MINSDKQQALNESARRLECIIQRMNSLSETLAVNLDSLRMLQTRFAQEERHYQNIEAGTELIDDAREWYSEADEVPDYFDQRQRAWAGH